MSPPPSAILLLVSLASRAENGSEVTFKNRGNWFDVGLGVQSPFTENLYVFLDAEYRFGNDLQKSWQFNTGVRWLF